MSNSPNEVHRRKFIQKASLGIIGAASLGATSSLSSSSFPTSNVKTVNDFSLKNKGIREEFMLQPGLSYFNTGSLGPSPKTVIEKVWKITQSLELNPVGSNWGELGQKANNVRKEIADYINVQEDEIILTRNTTEGMNILARGLQLKPGDEIITSTDEHYGGQAGWEFLEKYNGVKIKRVEFPRKNLSADQVIEIIKKQITPRTRICSLMDVSTVTGMRIPFAQLADITRPKEILLICDGAQSAGMLPVDIKAMKVDAFATSGHKWMLGPKETGFLFLSKDMQSLVKTTELETGYKLYNHNTGTRNVANVIGLGEAIKTQESWGGISQIADHNLSLADNLKNRLKEHKELQLITPEALDLRSGIISVIPKNQESKKIYNALKQKNIIVKNLGKINVLRFSNHIFNTREEIDLLVTNLFELLK